MARSDLDTEPKVLAIIGALFPVFGLIALGVGLGIELLGKVVAAWIMRLFLSGKKSAS